MLAGASATGVPERSVRNDFGEGNREVMKNAEIWRRLAASQEISDGSWVE
jgi:hypothetical protein